MYITSGVAIEGRVKDVPMLVANSPSPQYVDTNAKDEKQPIAQHKLMNRLLDQMKEIKSEIKEIKDAT